jgi:DNA modification methylase
MLHDWKNQLYYGNNLEILRDHIRDESIDLIYLDPPFNSNVNYNILFQEKGGENSAAQITAFEDTWHWTQESETAFHEVITQGLERLVTIMHAIRGSLGENDMMAYLTMMAARLIELHRVLKPTGSIFLHCDPTASHYLKLMMDAIFRIEHYRNEIIWKRAETIKGNFGQGSKRLDVNTDTILFYRKTEANTFNFLFTPYTKEYIKDFYKYVELETGRQYRLISMTGPGGAAKGNPSYEVMGVTRYWRYSKQRMQALIDAGLVVQTSVGGVPQRKQYLDEGKGVPIQSLWDDIPGLHSQAAERLGYPTQKPEALLERVIKAASNEGDLVLDPFCGCGTTINVAERLHRQWIGIDITHLAISLIKTRLHDTYKSELAPFEVIGEPKDVSSAEALALHDRYQFQWWAVGLVKGRPAQDKKKGKDTGIDGNLYFFDDNTGKAKRIIIQVKSGNVKSGDIRDLKGVLEREKAELGAFISLKPATRDMIKEAVSAGFYESQHYGKFPKLQILTVEEILNGAKLQYPQTGASGTFKRAERQSKSRTEQDGLF